MSDHITYHELKRLIIFTVVLLLVLALAFLFIWIAWRVVFLAFAGLMLAIVLNSFSKWVEHVTHLSSRLAYLITIGSILLLTGLTAWFFVPRIISQAGQIVALIPASLVQAENSLNKSPWGHHVVQFVQQASARAETGSKVTTAASGVVDAFAGALVVLVVGFYGALNPAVYVNGLLGLVREKRRDMARHVGTEVLYTLRWWLLGQLVPMAVLGIVTMIGLWALHVPLAFTLGLFTALMIFIPYLGALASAIPAVLVALKQGPMTMLYVMILYLAVHVLEAYVLTPLVQKRAARLPPIVTILSEFLLWILTGVLGVAIATPLAAAVLVSFRILYLHENIDHRSREGLPKAAR